MVMFSNKGDQWFHNPKMLYGKNYKDTHNSLAYDEHGDLESGCKKFIKTRYADIITIYLDGKMSGRLFGEYVIMVDKKPYKVEYCPFCGIKL